MEKKKRNCLLIAVIIVGYNRHLLFTLEASEIYYEKKKKIKLAPSIKNISRQNNILEGNLPCQKTAKQQ